MQKIKEIDRIEIVKNVLDIIGVSKHKIGYIYLAAYVSKVWEEKDTNPRPLSVYGNEIAAQGGLFIGHMHSAIKYAIEEAWFLGNYKILEYIFGYSLETIITEAPSPNNFISELVSVLSSLEKNNADIYAFFKFIYNGGDTITRVSEANCATRY